MAKTRGVKRIKQEKNDHLYGINDVSYKMKPVRILVSRRPKSEEAKRRMKRDAARIIRAAEKEHRKDVYEARKKMDRIRYYKRVAEGKIKTICQLSGAEKEKLQMRRREEYKRYYAKKKLKEREKAELTAAGNRSVAVKCEQTSDAEDEVDPLKLDEELSPELAMGGIIADIKCIKEDSDGIHLNFVICSPNEESILQDVPNGPESISSPNSSENFIATGEQPYEQALGVQPHEQVIGAQYVIKGDWVAVKHGPFWYPGLVMEVSNIQVTVDCMVKNNESDNRYIWSPDPDLEKLIVEKSEILYKLKTPPRPVDRLNFALLEDDLIERIFRENRPNPPN